MNKALRWCFERGFGALAIFAMLFPVTALILGLFLLWPLSAIFHPPKWVSEWVGGLIGGLIVAAIGLQYLLGWWLWRQGKKDGDVSLAALAEKRADIMRAMQEQSYWGCAKETPVMIDEPALESEGFRPSEIMTWASYIARAQVKQEIQAQGLKMREIAASDISGAVKALLAARPQLIEQAIARAKESKKRRKRKARKNNPS